MCWSPFMRYFSISPLCLENHHINICWFVSMNIHKDHVYLFTWDHLPLFKHSPYCHKCLNAFLSLFLCDALSQVSGALTGSVRSLSNRWSLAWIITNKQLSNKVTNQEYAQIFFLKRKKKHWVLHQSLHSTDESDMCTQFFIFNNLLQ